jgi:homoserine dehydrogenase
VVAVVSAIGETTERLLAAATSYGHAPCAHATAALVSTGEVVSASHVWLGCDRAGLAAVAVDPREIGLSVRGPALDAIPIGVNAPQLSRLLDSHAVVVVPGFFGIDQDGRVALLGRGGSDLTALLLGEAIGARCRLIKDVPGLYERDPSRPGPFARRFGRITFADAERLDGAILQRKALAYARSRRFEFEVAAIGQGDATVVGAARTEFAMDVPITPSRVALLGCGVVGRGVWQHLHRASDAFEVVGVAVRSPKRHADVINPSSLHTDAIALARHGAADIVVETIGGTDVALACVEAAIARGVDVVTANKALLAEHGERLAALADASGARLYASAAVGGAAPVLESIVHLAPRGVAAIEGVLNGTTNHILGLRAQGMPFSDALREAQSLGFAETDPRSDLHGTDAATKLILACRKAFGRDPDRMQVSGLDPSAAYIEFDRLVARASWQGSELVGSVRVERLPHDHPLLRARGVWNRVIVTLRDGSRRIIDGKGAGRWPTAEALFADVREARQSRMSAGLELCAGGAA